MASGLLYRLTQKWKYHTGNSVEKKIAEINRYEPLIISDASTFKVKDCDLVFSLTNHIFIIDRFEWFETLLKNRGKFKIEGSDLIYSIDGISLKVTTAEELFIIIEIYLERCYLIKTVGNYSVIDIGMNVGFASLFFANAPQVTAVHGYEPFKPTYNDALSNFELNPMLKTKIAPNDYGLSAKTELLTMGYSSNLKGKNSTQNTKGSAETIELKDINGVFDALFKSNPQENYFVKMDCEGSEFEIFEALEKRGIPNQIFGFIIEWHVRNPQPIVDVLLSNNFKVQLRGDAEIGLITAFR